MSVTNDSNDECLKVLTAVLVGLTFSTFSGFCLCTVFLCSCDPCPFLPSSFLLACRSDVGSFLNMVRPLSQWLLLGLDDALSCTDHYQTTVM